MKKSVLLCWKVVSSSKQIGRYTEFLLTKDLQDGVCPALRVRAPVRPELSEASGLPALGSGLADKIQFFDNIDKFILENRNVGIS
jgi:hypothetical protein